MSRRHDPQLLDRALAHAGFFDQIFLATTDAAGCPHLDVAGTLEDAADPLVLRGFFSATTMDDVRANPRLELLAWDTHEQRGLKIRGTLEQSRETALLDGYVPALDAGTPQVEHELHIRVEEVLLVERRPRRERPLGTRPHGDG